MSLELLLKNILKYLLEGIAVAVAAKYIPSREIAFNEVMMIAVTAALTFFLLDLFSPSIASGARMGAGFGVGANLVGFPAA
jgi:hypothetical protein